MESRELVLNHYKCGRCAYEWDDIYDCAVDDDCANCGARHYTPVWSAGANATYERFLFISPVEDSVAAVGPFGSAAARDEKASAYAERFCDRRIVMLDMIEDGGKTIPVVFPYQSAMLASPA